MVIPVSSTAPDTNHINMGVGQYVNQPGGSVVIGFVGTQTDRQPDDAFDIDGLLIDFDAKSTLKKLFFLFFYNAKLE